MSDCPPIFPGDNLVEESMKPIGSTQRLPVKCIGIPQYDY
jgi:plasmid maintenance system antidote protein VapI